MTKPSRPTENRLDTPELRLKGLLFEASQPDNPIRPWIARLARYGLTQSFLKDLRSVLNTIEAKGHADLVRLKDGSYVLTAPIQEFGGTESASVDQTAALLVAVLLQDGSYRNLRKCAATDCDNFHVRRGKWCSDNCGGRVRNKALRRRRRLQGGPK